MTLDNGGPFDQLLDKWKALDAGVSPEARREAAVSFVMRELGSGSRITRALLEAAYDRLFPPRVVSREPQASSSRLATRGSASHEPQASFCPECGLNDGHHYAKCSHAY